ncbi:DNA cytosine methyltransferase [Psychrosphaera algicola]|uniref:Cytosine-specific methyltransferase n=1 Tax=Psychrosphaera algicola TaxID=3023714 RepID=A0ABT5FAY1_9GAMM|nr:DNA (cytosine-5-)-methyltransferase [Psychrosphaera sp. G1-22]MDC2888700.1 DNA (cytosine-5-)-methyltransferase [Psychrosphaera sp. G1-22]
MAIKRCIWKRWGLDLVSGGPPCQSFSMAGKREQNSDKNALPWEFAKFVGHVQPKLVLLENVTGILRAFKDAEGKSFHAWYEVAKVFASIGYIPLCLHVNARMAGVPQNRPRFIMIGVRNDHFKIIEPNFNEADVQLFAPSLEFYNLVKKYGAELPFGKLGYFDATKSKDLSKFENSFLHNLVGNTEVSVKEALNDLKFFNKAKPSKYVTKLNSTFDNLKTKTEIKNHELRRNSPLVKRRFRLYQVLQLIGHRHINKAVFEVLKGNTTKLEDDVWAALKCYEFLHENGELDKFDSKTEFQNYLLAHPTKKQTQKALVVDSPAPAALSIPDDACHYDENELRVLTVREMARIQSFPDSFVFRSKITTGGQMRKFEVPQYTQVGNAVPPLLGLALGNTIKNLLTKS